MSSEPSSTTESPNGSGDSSGNPVGNPGPAPVKMYIESQMSLDYDAGSTTSTSADELLAAHVEGERNSEPDSPGADITADISTFRNFPDGVFVKPEPMR